MDEEVKTLERTKRLVKRKLKTIFNKLEAATKFVSQFDVSQGNTYEVQVRIDNLTNIAEQFEICQTELEDIEEEVSDEQRVKERLVFEDHYFNVKASLMNLAEKSQEKHSSSQSLSEVNKYSNENAMKLPPINAPRFNGDWQKWTSFIDTYNAMFHNNSTLAPVQRLHYLKSCLDGQARDVIQSIPTTGENYLQAYNTLVNRYENKGAIIQAHIRSLFETPKVQIASSTELQSLHHNIMSNVNALRALQQPVDSWDAWLVTLVCNRLDRATVGEWQIHYNKKDLPTFSAIESFLFNRISAYEAGDMNSSTSIASTSGHINTMQSTTTKSKPPNNSSKLNEKRVFFTKSDDGRVKCVVCNFEHNLYQCVKFKNLSVKERRDTVFANRLCFNCLKSDHQVRQCKSSSCTICNKKHNTLLHYNNEELVEETSQSSNDNQSRRGSSSIPPNIVGCGMVNNNVHGSSNLQVILATAVVYVYDTAGNAVHCRAVLDSGSQLCFITNKMARRLGLDIMNNTVSISGIGQSQAATGKCCMGTVQSRVGQAQFKLQFHVLPTITNDLPTQIFKLEQLNIPSEIQSNLADPTYDKPGSIDILLGAEIFFDILRQNKHMVSEHAAFQDTAFGWVLIGKVFSSTSWVSAIHPIISQDSALSLSATTVPTHPREEEEMAEQHFLHTTSRNEIGQFVVRLPLKENPTNIGNTSLMVQKRFLNLERKLTNDKVMAKEYDEFLKEYLSMGHMDISGQFEQKQSNCYYMPHHAVFKSTSMSTKMRVVFDAAAVGSLGKSLNDILLKGPVVQPTLYSTLLRFRMHQIALTADIEKMYRQILVHADDRHLQKIVYRSKPTDKLQEFTLNTVTYGTKSAPYLATRCLIELGKTCEDSELGKIIQRDFYVDDLLSGADTEEQCYDIFQKITSILGRARLPLRKWCSNSSTLLSMLPTTTDDNHLFTLSESDSVSVLGLLWQPKSDSFRFFMKAWSPPKRMTKRSLLSDISSIYDPIGLITPVLIKGKIFVQQLWSLKINWDDILSEDLCSKWIKFYLSLHHLVNLSVPRKMVLANVINIQIHGFCDSSQLAFGSCVYLRSLNCDGRVYVHLYTSRSRVAPMKATTIPRLELCAAVLLAELVTEVQEEMKQLNIVVSSDNIFLWSDSKIVLAWILSKNMFQVYVSNRIAQIQELTDKHQWHHVPTKDNPADLITRGIDAASMASSKLWWNGPSWLSKSKWFWPNKPVLPEELPEVRPVKLALITGGVKSRWLLSKYSRWNILIRVTALVRRFITNCKCRVTKQRENCLVGFIKVNELLDAERFWLKDAQSHAFSEELACLKSGRMVRRGSALRSLCPFIDQHGLIRVGGRLDNANVEFNQKHPIVLPSKDLVTNLIFQHEHSLLHLGPQSLLALISNKYWTIRGRIIARKTVHKCLQCFRARPTFLSPFMAPLPRVRVIAERVFSKTGVDYCGPIMVKSGRRRVSPTKAYICVFICMVTRSVHLELVSSLSAEDFLATLSRFMARRGLVSQLFSDNGTNFVGAHRILRDQFREYYKNKSVADFLSIRRIEWHFIPAAAPHFGGLWEAAVQAAKRHLLRISKGILLSYDETITLLCNVEAALNSRPLTPMSSDPSDYSVLTPGHFLVGEPLTLPPERDVSNVPQNRLRRFKLMQAGIQLFWKRWSTEYLPQIQRRGKWTKICKNAAVGDLAILREDNVPPLKWSLVRVVQIHPGPDGVVRAVTVRNSRGLEFKRPSIKLALLPVEEDSVISSPPGSP